MATPNLGWTDNTGVSFEVEANTTFAEIENSITAVLSLAVTSSNALTISDANYRANVVFDIDEDGADPADAAITITVPATKRGFFAVINTTAFTVTVEISGQSKTAPIVSQQGSAMLVSDGTNVMAGI